MFWPPPPPPPPPHTHIHTHARTHARTHTHTNVSPGVRLQDTTHVVLATVHDYHNKCDRRYLESWREMGGGDRQTETERQRQTDRQTETDRQRVRDTHTHRQTETERRWERQRQTETDRQGYRTSWMGVHVVEWNVGRVVNRHLVASGSQFSRQAERRVMKSLSWISRSVIQKRLKFVHVHLKSSQ